jgi:vacuolar-type H+-ATPase subunit E/Vma4
MQEFSLEKISESIHYGKTKLYFEEVLSSYHNKNYRSSVVMLWSVAVCDIVYKLQSLIDLYDDASAKEILRDLTAIQEADTKSAAWEVRLIEDVFAKTNLLDSSEYENLRYLQKQRHLSAHPVLNANRELHSPNKETVRSLLRNTLEGVLTKPPFYTQHIMKEILSDLEESATVLNTRKKVKKYVESRYFSRTTVPVELNLIRSFWKFVFKLENKDCEKNRGINLHLLEVLAARNPTELVNLISGDKDYFSNVSALGEPILFLVYFLSIYPDLYEHFNEDAILKIKHCIASDEMGKTIGWFEKESLEKHSEDIHEWILSSEHPHFSEEQFDLLLDMSDSKEWQISFCKIVSSYYGCSTSYDQADSRFQLAIPLYISLFDKESIVYLAQKIESNSQCHDRSRARLDYVVIKKKIDQLFEGVFDYSEYTWFSRKLDLGD